jgi:hypothetical protein
MMSLVLPPSPASSPPPIWTNRVGVSRSCPVSGKAALKSGELRKPSTASTRSSVGVSGA